jgi:dTDP-4-dehydrorhamnose 3,5-epimerase
MQAHRESIPDVITFNTHINPDERGALVPVFDGINFSVATGFKNRFELELETLSHKNVFRGLHYQTKNPQGKLIRPTHGEILDFCVDMRAWSPTFGMHVVKRLKAISFQSIWIPPGFAHGYLTLSPTSVVNYKLTAEWEPHHSRVLSWRYIQNDVGHALNDPFFTPILNWKDFQGEPFVECKYYEKPEDLECEF